MRVTAFKVEPGSPGVRSRAAQRLVCAAFALALLPACSWMPFRHGSREGRVNDCNKPQVYEQAGSSPPLRIPAGLDALNTRGALRIPELREPEAPRKLTDACLDEPPKYSSARLLPPPRDKEVERNMRKVEKAREQQLKAEEKRKRAEEKAAAKSPPAPAPAPAPASPPATP
jgi:hypothetical protein